MRHRVVICAAFPWLAAAMLSMVAACASQASRPGAAANTADPKRWVTPDGHSDLQGVWNFRTATPLERPPEFADQEFLNDESVAAVERRAAERLRVQGPDDQILNTPPWWLEYRLTFDDSTTWAAPWTVSFPLVKTDEPIYEYTCHEGNYSLRNILSIARAKEETVQAGQRR